MLKEKDKGITLVALVVTIVILLILAGISISTLTNTGIFQKAKDAKKASENAEKEQKQTLSEYERELNKYTAQELTDDKINTVLSEKENTILKDKFGNIFILPAGFKVVVNDDTGNAKTVVLGRLVVDMITRYSKNGLKDVDDVVKNNLVLVLLTILMGIFSYNSIKPVLDDKFVSEKSYPVSACDFILENIDLSTAKFYNEYNYGSYMLFRGIPVFIDSRADLYAPEFSGNKDEDIFSDFINTSSISKYYEDTFEKYNITHVILGKKSKTNLIINKSHDENYKEIYSDDNFVIYERLNAKK